MKWLKREGMANIGQKKGASNARAPDIPKKPNIMSNFQYSPASK